MSQRQPSDHDDEPRGPIPNQRTDEPDDDTELRAWAHHIASRAPLPSTEQLERLAALLPTTRQPNERQLE